MKYKKYVIANGDDRSLTPFVVWLPKPPSVKLMNNYQRAVENQKFEKTIYPESLKALEKTIDEGLKQKEINSSTFRRTPQRFIRAMWEELLANPAEYKKEIEFIKTEQYRLKYGYWVMIYGEPTWITPWHYRYLNYWTIDDVDEVEYRERDWKFFVIADWIYRVHTDQYGNQVYRTEPDNKLSRMLLGFLYPKHRRDGATHKSLCIGYSILMEAGARKHFGIQSFDKSNARTHYVSKLLPSFEDMPFFVKPIWKGDPQPLGGMTFNPAPGIGAGKGLGSEISYANSADAKHYDGGKQIAHLSDENGKTVLEDVVDRHGIVRNTMATGGGSNITGYSMHPSTVEDLEERGGDNYKRLADASMFTGNRTESWLVTIFESAAYGLEGFVDIFGASIVDDPEESDLWRIPKPNRDDNKVLRGARRYLIEERSRKLLSRDPKTVTEGIKDSQRFPLEYVECWGATDGNAGFDIQSLKERERELEANIANGISNVDKGNFYWVIDQQEYSANEFVEAGFHLRKGITDNAHVIWKYEDNGLFNLSYMPIRNNERVMNDNVWYPKDPDPFTICGDPYQFLGRAQRGILKEKSGLSDGGISMFWEQDYKIDPQSKDIREWESNRTILTFKHRHQTTEAFGEEFIMAMVYFGAMAFPERNVKDLLKYIIDRGFSGYLLYLTDTLGKPKPEAGFHSGTESKQELFQSIRSYVRNHIHRERHLDLIKEIIAIRSLEDMTNYDLFTAAAGAIYGSKSRYREMIQEARKQTAIEEDIIETFVF